MKVKVKNFAPFEEASIDIKPLTIFIGKNSVGKSNLLYLLWTLMNFPPDYDELVKLTYDKEYEDLENRAFEKISQEKMPRDEIMSMLRKIWKNFPKAFSKAIFDNLLDIFNIENIDELKLKKEDKIEIIVEGLRATFKISDPDNGEWISYDNSSFNEISISLYATNSIRIKFKDFDRIEIIQEPSAITTILSAYMGFFLIRDIIGPIAETIPSMLLVDGRAGVNRTLLSLYPMTASGLLDRMLKVDSKFIENEYSLGEKLSKNKIKLEAKIVKTLFKELGVEEMLAEKVYGLNKIFVKLIGGTTLPLEKAPSGVRETIPLILALCDENIKTLLIEEPEAHLHPSAVRTLARFIAYSINELDKTVLLTTHSDWLISSLNNLIKYNSKLDRAEKIGIDKNETLNAEKVAAYLMKYEKNKFLIEMIPVDKEEGIKEKIFEEIAKELIGESSFYYE